MPMLLELVATYGYVVIFLVVMAESAGVPLPGETSLLVAGALAATGHIWLPGVIAAAALGAIIGDTAGYWVGRTSGVRLLRRHERLLRFDEEKLTRAEAFFARHGDKTVFLGRFVPVGRIFTAVLAGVSRMEYRRFLLWNAAGGIVWACVMGTVGYLFGHQLPLIERVVQQFGLGLLALVLVAVAARVAMRHRGVRAAWRQFVRVPLEAWWARRGEGIVALVRALPVRRYRWHLIVGSGVVVLLGVALGGLVMILT
jgi:membrane protein DedA with SNARE-associated domain